MTILKYAVTIEAGIKLRKRKWDADKPRPTSNAAFSTNAFLANSNYNC